MLDLKRNELYPPKSIANPSIKEASICIPKARNPSKSREPPATLRSCNATRFPKYLPSSSFLLLPAGAHLQCRIPVHNTELLQRIGSGNIENTGIRGRWADLAMLPPRRLESCRKALALRRNGVFCGSRKAALWRNRVVWSLFTGHDLWRLGEEKKRQNLLRYF
jgi:hypothetical protein